jgi:hypothetical protein
LTRLGLFLESTECWLLNDVPPRVTNTVQPFPHLSNFPVEQVTCL